MGIERPDVKAYFAAMAGQSGPSIIDIPPATARQMSRQMGGVMELPARKMLRQDVTVPALDGHQIPVRIYSPTPAADPAPVLVFYHGGGWVLGDVEGYDSLCSEVAFQMNLTVVSVDYRLGPENLYPAAIEDSREATRWVAASPDAIGHTVSGLILAGDSAGGSLAAGLSRALLGTLPVPVLAQWLIYPVTDLTRNYPSDIELSMLFNLTEEGKEKFYRYYFGEDNVETKKADPLVSPLLGEIWQGLPPAVVFTCSLDPLRDQGRAYAAKLASHGIETLYYEGEGQIHGSFTMRKVLPSAQDDLLKGIAALKLLVGNHI